MRSRPHGRKSTLALWMLVAVADVVVLIATAGLLTVLVVLAGLVTLAGVIGGRWLMQRRPAPATMLLQRRPAPATMLLQRRPTAAAVSRPPVAFGRRRA